MTDCNGYQIPWQIMIVRDHSPLFFWIHSSTGVNKMMRNVGNKTFFRMFYNNNSDPPCCWTLPGDDSTTSFGTSMNRNAAFCFHCGSSFDGTVHREEAVYASDSDRKTAWRIRWWLQFVLRFPCRFCLPQEASTLRFSALQSLKLPPILFLAEKSHASRAW